MTRSMMLFLGLLACKPAAAPAEQPYPADTGEPEVLTLDTASFLPTDTGPLGTTDLVPTHWLTIQQAGTWTLTPLGGPFTDLSGALEVVEFVDTLDPLEPEYACQARYALTGQVVDAHTCGSCDFVFEVNFYVNEGDASACREPDTPQHEDSWRMGYSSSEEKILRNYQGSGVWVPWHDATMTGNDVTFTFEEVLAIFVDETTP